MIAVLILGLVLGPLFPPNASQNPAKPARIQTTESRGIRHLERLDETKLRNLIRSRHGRALFINVWATWCEPCVQEFPDIVKLADEMKGEKIDFVGVSGDYVEDEASKVIPFIVKEKATFEFYIAKLEGEDTFINAFDPHWGGGIPATFTFDSKGQLKAFLVGKQSYHNLKAAAEKALAK